MTKRDARIIRKFRKRHTWRGVARLAAEKWPKRNYSSGNQIEGIELCEIAAKTLNEDPHKKPWN